MRSIVVTGADGPIGRRAVLLLRAEPDVDVVEVADAAPLPERADTIVHLAWAHAGPRDIPSDHNVELTRRLLQVAANPTLTSFVLLSSATVYGGWPDNPVPLTEEAPLRPNAGVVDAVHHAEAERLVGVWAADHPHARVAVLRPATVVGPGVDSWLVDAFSGRGVVRPLRADRDRQFVHVDDVATAVVLAAIERLDGVFNVAPSGVVADDMVRELSAWRPSIPVPGWAAPAAVRWAWALGLSSVPPWLRPLVEYSWIVAGDRLQAAGWEPRHTSEEAIVAGRPPSRWREMSPGRRQSVALVAAGLGVTSVAAAVGIAVTRARARTRRSVS